MEPRGSSADRSRTAGTGRWFCLIGASLGALGLIGWMSGMPSLTEWVPRQPPMMPNAALGLLAIGIAGALRRRSEPSPAILALSVLAAALALAIGVATLFEYVLDVDLHIDAVLFHSRIGLNPARPSPPTALAITLLASGILLYDSRPQARFRPSEWLILCAGIVAFVALTGLLLGAGPLYRFTHAPMIGVALPTSISVLAISAGLLLERPNAGIMRVATSRGPGGVILRRLAAPSILGPLILGIVASRLASVLGVRDFALMVATLAVSMTLVGLGLLTITALLLNRSYEALELNRAETRDLVAHASDGIFIADANGRYTDVNAAGCKLLGMTRDEIVGLFVSDLLAPEEVGRLEAAREELLRGGVQVAEWHLRHKSGRYIPVEVSSKILPDGRWQGLVRDISERKAAEDAARRAQAKIEGIISIASDAIISINEEQRITIFNRGAEAIFGWSARDVVGQPIDLLIPERFRVKHRGYIRGFGAEAVTARKMGERVRSIFGLRKDGTEFPAEAAISKLVIGTETTFTVVLRDVTERVRLEREVLDARVFLENVLESSIEYSLIALDLDRHILLWNEGAHRSYGYSSKELVGMVADMLHTSSDLASGVASSLYARALEEGSAEAVMCRRRKDGSEFLARVVVSRRDGADGQPTGFLLVTRDVTSEQRRLEQEQLLAGIGLLLTSSLDREQIASSVADLLVRDFADACILDLADDPERNGVKASGKVVLRDGRKRELAAALEKIPFDRRLTIVGASRQSRRSTLVSHVTPEHLDRIARSPEHRRLLEELAPVSMISVPLQARGLLLGVLTFVSSRHSRRYDENDVAFVDALGQRVALAIDNARLFETATKAVGARDEVLRVVAHDLRNPLGNILMQASLLRSMKADPESKMPKLAEGIERAARRMNRLIKDLLDVSRLESGHLAVEPVRISARQLVGDAVEGQRALASRGSIDLQCAIPRDLPDVLADRDRMLQVFENLIGNAIKFTPPGGHVTVGASAHDGHVTFCVSDTGSGISDADLPHVFDRFWQVQKSEGGGAGLGLTIVKGLVEAQGGHIHAESAPGKGTTFFFTVPVAPSIEDAKAQNVQRAAGS